MQTVDPKNPYRRPSSRDVAALTEWYDNNRSARNRADLATLQATSAAVFAATDLAVSTHHLGPGEHDWIDLVRPIGATQALPALVFVHGGRWQLNTSRETAFWARACAQEGLAFVGLNFPPLTQLGLLAMMEAVSAAVARVVAAAEALQIDPDSIVLAGHSSGAHLALGSVLPGLGQRTGCEVARWRALLLLGGIYELEPLCLSQHQASLGIDLHEAREASPLLALEQAQAREQRLPLPPVMVAVGAQESVEFVRQSQALHWALKAHRPAEWLAIDETAHFDAALEFNREVSQLRGFVMRHLGRSGGKHG